MTMEKDEDIIARTAMAMVEEIRKQVMKPETPKDDYPFYGLKDDLTIYSKAVINMRRLANLALKNVIDDENKNVKWVIRPTDIEWEMDWSGTKEDGTRRYPDKPDKEMVFEETAALAHMLTNEVIFLNNHWWMEKEGWPQEATQRTSLNVNCNDVFAWGCAESECLNYQDIETLYRMWRKDPKWGAAIWCIIKRKELPQGPVVKMIRQEGIWDLDALTQEHGLRRNAYDGLSRLRAQRQYLVYSDWVQSEGRVPLEFDVGWWKGWKEYIAAHPNWYSDEWKAEDSRQREVWLKDNGYK